MTSSKKTPTKPRRKSPSNAASKPRKRGVNKPRVKKQSAQDKPIWKRVLRVLWSIGWKLALCGIAIVALLLIYFSTSVDRKFSGQLFDLPTVVYAKVVTLAPEMDMTIAEFRQELDILNYRKVANPKFPGEYSASSKKIELIRRPFSFQDGPEPARHVEISFDGAEIASIYSLDRKSQLGFLRLEPKMLGMLENNVVQQRLFVKREEFPEFLVDALLTTEDRDFYKHDGVSPTAILRALVVNLKAGRTVQGGSTLTQQLSKNLFLSSERTLWRKVREAIIAVIIDYRYDKDRILEAYLNEVFVGQSGGQAIHGFGLAARYFFGQPIQELRIDQQAMLVGLVKGPSYYNPIRNPQRALERRDLILRLMMQEQVLTPTQYEMAVSRGLDLQETPRIASRQPAYFEQLKHELQLNLGESFVNFAGLKVFTSLDPVSQTLLEQSIRTQIPILEKGSSVTLEAAAVAVDRQSGELRAMVGGKRTDFDGFNRALNAQRPIGSLVKPAVYLTAWAQPDKYQLATNIEDEPIQLKGSQGSVWSPRNFDRKFRGIVPLYQSLAYSLNVPTVKLGMMLGIKNVQTTIESLGVGQNEVRPVPAMFLGAFALSPLQVTQMYQTITNSGRKAPISALRVVMNQEGEVLYRSLPRIAQVVPEQAAWLTTYALRVAVAKGTGRYLGANIPHKNLAGKTGTSNDRRDSWFVGVDGREVVTVWLGNDDNKETPHTGSSGALRIYTDYLGDRRAKTLQLNWPENLTTLGYDKQNDGEFTLNCQSDFKLPVWDKTGSIKDECSTGLRSILNRLLKM